MSAFNEDEFRRAAIIAEAQRFQDISDSYRGMDSWWGDDYKMRGENVYRDMAAALRLLADERGT